MDEQELNELRKYKSTKEFAKAHKAKETIEEEAASGSLLASIIKSGVEYAAESIKDQLEDELDPLGLRWYFPSEEAKANGRRLERLEQLDAKRPEIKDYLKFDVMPKEKAASKVALCALPGTMPSISISTATTRSVWVTPCT